MLESTALLLACKAVLALFDRTDPSKNTNLSPPVATYTFSVALTPLALMGRSKVIDKPSEETVLV